MSEDTGSDIPNTPSTWMRVTAVGLATSAVSFLLPNPLDAAVLGVGAAAVLAGAVMAWIRWLMKRKR
jgi:hypothetical protein